MIGAAFVPALGLIVAGAGNVTEVGVNDCVMPLTSVMRHRFKHSVNDSEIALTKSFVMRRKIGMGWDAT